MVDFGFRSYLPMSLGQVVITRGAAAAMDETNSTPMPLLVRHSAGDWGDICDEDRTLNEQALVEGSRVMSVYTLRDGKTVVWVITEWDRSITTILLPSEY